MAERKKPQRARIDAIIGAIGRGDYDDKLSDLKEAINARNAERQAALRERVLEVFGPDFVITEKTSNVFMDRAQRSGRDLTPEGPEADEVKARAAQVAAELSGDPPPARDPAAPAPGDPFGDGIVEEGKPAEQQAVEIVSAPERASSPAFGGDSPVSQPSTPAVQASDDDDGYESRSPIIIGGPPQ